MKKKNDHPFGYPMFTEEQKFLDYWEKLIGKKVAQPLMQLPAVKIINVQAAKIPWGNNHRIEFPEAIRYGCKPSDQIVIPFEVVIQLIETGYGKDAIGHDWKIVD